MQKIVAILSGRAARFLRMPCLAIMLGMMPPICLGL